MGVVLIHSSGNIEVPVSSHPAHAALSNFWIVDNQIGDILFQLSEAEQIMFIHFSHLYFSYFVNCLSHYISMLPWTGLKIVGGWLQWPHRWTVGDPVTEKRPGFNTWSVRSPHGSKHGLFARAQCKLGETVLRLCPPCREIPSWVILSKRDLLADIMLQLSTVIRKLQNKKNLENIWCLLPLLSPLHGLHFIIYWQWINLVLQLWNLGREIYVGS